MREVAPGDVIFSFRDTRIAALGIARSYCYESPKPTEFGTAGSYWEAIGWKIDVSFRELNNRIHPKSHIGELHGLPAEKYSPLRANGEGPQNVYLAEVGRPFAVALFRLIGGEANKVADAAKEVGRAEQLSPSREPYLEQCEGRLQAEVATGGRNRRATGLEPLGSADPLPHDIGKKNAWVLKGASPKE
jgi:hypothetical protein